MTIMTHSPSVLRPGAKDHVRCGCFPTGRHYPGIAHRLAMQTRGCVPGLDPNAPWVDLPIAAIDTETTGRHPERGDRVLEIGVVVGRQGRIERRHNFLMHPDRDIPAAATAVHGIDEVDVDGAPSFAAIARAVADTFAGAIPLAYNAGFDRSFLAQEFAFSDLPPTEWPAAFAPDAEWIDPLVWARELQRFEAGGKTLGKVAERLKIDVARLHRASDDAETALAVLYAFATLGDSRLPTTYGALLTEQRKFATGQDDDYRSWARSQNVRGAIAQTKARTAGRTA